MRAEGTYEINIYTKHAPPRGSGIIAEERVESMKDIETVNDYKESAFWTQQVGAPLNSQQLWQYTRHGKV